MSGRTLTARPRPKPPEPEITEIKPQAKAETPAKPETPAKLEVPAKSETPIQPEPKVEAPSLAINSNAASNMFSTIRPDGST